MGDDVAALRAGGVTLLLTTDALAEGTHFLPRSPPEAVGRAAVAASLSDLAAKGGIPLAVLLALLLPRGSPAAWAERVVAGAEAMAARHRCHVVGGDTKAARARVVVGMAVGRATSRRLPRHDGARPGDLLLVTGTVGSGGGRGRALRGQRPTPSDLARLLAIEPRLTEGRLLAPRASAMMDTSDGLAAALERLARASRVRVEVDEALLPWDPGLRGLGREADRTKVAFYGGDYELLAAVGATRARPAARAIERAGGRATIVGRVLDGTGAFLRSGPALRPVPTAGWDPFAPPPRWGTLARRDSAHASFK
jgi:thiamine-monophosphate kinase